MYVPVAISMLLIVEKKNVNVPAVIVMLLIVKESAETKKPFIAALFVALTQVINELRLVWVMVLTKKRAVRPVRDIVLLLLLLLLVLLERSGAGHYTTTRPQRVTPST